MAALPRLVGAALALVLGTDGFLVYGALVAHAVTPEEAVARYRRAPGPPVVAGPPPGVYTYDTTGYAHVDALGVRRTYPRVSSRIVRGHGCGWREEVPLFTEHVETYDHCPGAEAGFGTRLTYFFVPAVTALRCADGRCVDEEHDVSADLTVAREGAGSAVVGGAAVACERVTVTTVLRGSNTGGAVRRLCLDPRGLVLTEERSVGIVARSAFVGQVVYTERATFTLRSLEPLL
jgi:hypothetical protein